MHYNPQIMSNLTYELKLCDEYQARAAQWGIKLTPRVFNNFIRHISGIDTNNVIFERNKCYLWTGATQGTVKGGSHGVLSVCRLEWSI